MKPFLAHMNDDKPHLKASITQMGNCIIINLCIVKKIHHLISTEKKTMFQMAHLAYLSVLRKIA